MSGNNNPSNSYKDYMWLADAPLFIDQDQVERFYDAVVRPVSKERTIKLEVSKEKIKEIRGKLGAEAGISLPSFLDFLFKADAKLSAEGEAKGGETQSSTTTIELDPIESPQRQLEDLTIHYLLKHQERIFLVNNPAEEDWRKPETILDVPRELVFLDLPGQAEAVEKELPETKLIPTAVEFENGVVELLFDKLKSKEGCPPPKYPDSSQIKKYPELVDARKKYWSWYDEHFNAVQAILTVEKAGSSNGRIRWIDFRTPINSDGSTLHLHICPSGKYDTGVFAYNLIKRGLKHGLRLVGTLKSEPDMNVLAIYEK